MARRVARFNLGRRGLFRAEITLERASPDEYGFVITSGKGKQVEVTVVKTTNGILGSGTVR